MAEIHGVSDDGIRIRIVLCGEDLGFATPRGVDCEKASTGFRSLCSWWGTVRDLMLAGFCLLLMIGCSSSSETISTEDFLKSLETRSASAEAKTAEAVAINTEAIADLSTKIDGIESAMIETRQAISTLEASLVNSDLNSQEVIKSALQPPAIANTQQDVVKVAEPGAVLRTASDGTRLRWNVEGNWNPTILETSRHLGEDHGINTNGMTHQQMADLHAELHDGKTVAAKSKPVQYSTRVSSCPGGVCPTNTRQKRGLFWWRR